MKNLFERFNKSHIAVRIGLVALIGIALIAGIVAAVPNQPDQNDVVGLYPTAAPYSEFEGHGEGEISSDTPKVASVVEEAPSFTMEIVYDFTDTTTYTRSYETGMTVYTDVYNRYVYKTDSAGLLVWTDDPQHPMYAMFQP